MKSMERDETDATQPSRDSAQDAAGFGGVRGLLDLLPVGVFVIDREQRIRTLNPAASRLVGVTEGSALGLRCSEVFRCSHCGPKSIAILGPTPIAPQSAVPLPTLVYSQNRCTR